MNKITTYIIAAAALSAFCITNPAQSLAADYPTAHNSRPLTLPGGVFTAGTDVNMNFKPEFAAGMGISVGYGIIDDMDITIAWDGMALTPEFAINKGTNIGLAYSVLKTDDNAHALAIALDAPLYVSEDKAFNNIGLGADYRLNLMDSAFSIYAGHGLLNLEIENAAGELGMSVALNLGFAYQAMENLNIRLDMWVLNAPLVGGGDVTSIADMTPIALTTTYAIDNSMDVGLKVTTEVQNAVDTLAVGLFFDWRML